jgi:hypothetical protein
VLIEPFIDFNKRQKGSQENWAAATVSYKGLRDAYG